MQANIRVFIINPSRRRYLGVKLHFYIIFLPLLGDGAVIQSCCRRQGV